MTDKERLDLMMSTNLAGIVKDDFLKWLGENGFFNAPASAKYHGNYAGGLFDHSFMVMNLLCLLYTSPSPRDRSVSRMPSSA